MKLPYAHKKYTSTDIHKMSGSGAASLSHNVINDVHTPPSLPSIAHRLTSQIPCDVFGIAHLYPAQLDGLEWLCMMRFKNSEVASSSLLFIQPTGGGKLLVRDVFSVMFRGASLTVVPILSLGANQKQKI